MTNLLEKYKKEQTVPKIDSFCFVNKKCAVYPITKVEDGRYFVMSMIKIQKGLALIVIKGRPRGRCKREDANHLQPTFTLKNVAHVVSPEFGEFLIHRKYLNIPEKDIENEGKNSKN